MLVAHADLLQDKQDLQTLVNQQTCIYVSAALRKNDWSDWCKAMHVEEPSETNRLSVTHTMQAIQAVKNKLGVFVTHQPLVTDDIKQGVLQIVPDSEFDNQQNYYLVEPVVKGANQAITNVKHWLLDQLVTQP